ncbi:preprotein translocase subunit SecY [Candidatus Uhrbacteria bacterium]|nr:preprotein translocase subunit SecY [Candidatus Uhrbacteria bacterium]
MIKKLKQIWKLPDLRNKILFVIAMLAVFRFAASVPIPGVNVANLRSFFQGNQIFGLMNIFSGGGLENFSIVAMGVAPYITSSIIFQLLAMIIPRFEALQKEGEYGRQKINQYTRYATVPLAVLQGYGLVMLLQQSPKKIIESLDPINFAFIILTLTAGTVFLMWIGELISEKKIGNGISLLIFAGIVAGLPSIIRSIEVLDATQITNIAIFVAIAILTIILVVFMTEGQRNIPVSYARQVRGIRMMGGVNTHLPLRVNQGGVIPIIFAISVVLFPPTIAQFFVYAKTPAIAHAAQAVVTFFGNSLTYGIFYFLMVVAFTFFYSAVVFKPEQVAENLQKQGGFVPGIRPGKPTADYLQNVVNRINLPAALFLAGIAVLPLAVQTFTPCSDAGFII